MIEDLCKLIEEADKIGYKAVFTYDPESCDPWTKTITINKRRKDRIKVIYFIHEFGHALMHKQMFIPFGRIVKPSDKTKRLLKIEDEILAWEYGRVQASKFIKIDYGSFNRIKNICLKTYLYDE